MTSRDLNLVGPRLKWPTSCATSVASEAGCCTGQGYTVAEGLAAFAGVGGGSLEACNSWGACQRSVDGKKRRRHSWGQTLASCHTGSGISLSDTAQNHRCSEKDLGVGVNEGYLVKETGPSAALGREMKKIEALLEGHPCLKDNRQTVADILGDLPLAFDPAADGPAAQRQVPGYGRLGGASSGTGRAIELEIEMAGPYFVRRVAGSEAVDNLSL